MQAGSPRYLAFFSGESMTPKSLEWAPLDITTPSAAKPRFKSSRTAEARLGILLEKRQSSNAASSSWPNMICSRSPRAKSPMRRPHNSSLIPR
jgi:hypothetical protein